MELSTYNIYFYDILDSITEQAIEKNTPG